MVFWFFESCRDTPPYLVFGVRRIANPPHICAIITKILKEPVFFLLITIVPSTRGFFPDYGAFTGQVIEQAQQGGIIAVDQESGQI